MKRYTIHTDGTWEEDENGEFVHDPDGETERLQRVVVSYQREIDRLRATLAKYKRGLERFGIGQ